MHAGMHTFHAFSPDTIEDYEGLGQKEYNALKERRADAIIDRLERACFPGLRNAITFREVCPAEIPLALLDSFQSWNDCCSVLCNHTFPASRGGQLTTARAQ